MYTNIPKAEVVNIIENDPEIKKAEEEEIINIKKNNGAKLLIIE
jgi:hypothetical protein